MSGKYLRFPLALLHTAPSATDFFNDAVHFSVVNAGIARRRGLNPEEWKREVKKLKCYTKIHHHEARIGADICAVDLGDSTGKTAVTAYKRIQEACQGSPLVNIKKETFWAACCTIRFDSGEGDPPSRSINWREFRLLVALSSLPPNTKGFSVAGWEIISHRACGFHRKKDFKAFSESEQPWPDHCIPLSRRQTETTLRRLESLRFFIRHRISRGDRGGLTAYSFRHVDHGGREKLANDCEEWQAFNRGEIVRENRSEDQLLHAEKGAARQERIRKNRSRAALILERGKSPENKPPAKPLPTLMEGEKQPSEPLKHSKRTSEGQVASKCRASMGASAAQAPVQHNEKCSSEKSLDEKSLHKSLNDSLAQALGSESEQEEGYLFDGRFLGREEANRIMVQFPESFSSFRRAKQISHPDGSKTLEEIQ